MIESAGGPRSARLAHARFTLEPEGIFTGYASLFGEEDLGRDVIMAGAFRRSLERRGAFGIRMLFQHDPGEPVGRWTVVREDGRGLYVEGRLTPGVARAAELSALLFDRAIDGLSIGFQTVRAKTDRKGGVRRILEADLWEISIVTFPMLPTARATSIKGRRTSRAKSARMERAERIFTTSTGERA